MEITIKLPVAAMAYWWGIVIPFGFVSYKIKSTFIFSYQLV
jgi:hypothetical protein